MKQLFLIRHGKSDWKNSDVLSDFDRPLNHRGNKDAPNMAKKILKRGVLPQLLVSSPAVRAISTAKHFADVWDAPLNIQTEASIYEAGIAELLHVVTNYNDDFDRIAMFGHNPGFTDFANYLCDEDIYNIPTAGIVIINFNTDQWEEVSYHTGTMLLFDFPKNTDDLY